MKKLFLSIFLSFVIILYSIPSAAYASMATASNAQLNIASSSDSDIDLVSDFDDLSGDPDYEEKLDALMSYSNMSLSDDEISAYSSGEQSYANFWNMNNTVTPDGCQIVPYYMSTDGTLKMGKSVPVRLFTAANSGYHYLGVNRTDVYEQPEDFAYMDKYLIQFSSTSLPSTGKYNMTFGFLVTELSKTDVSTFGFYTRKYVKNANFQDSYTVLDHYYASGEVTYDKVVDFANISYMEFRVYPGNFTSYWFPTQLRWAVVLDKVESGTVADVTTAGGSYTSTDAATDTANNTSQIAENTADISDTLKEIVQTISYQLAALWDQMYNIMHLRQLANDDKNTDRIINKQSEQIENDNANTEQVTGAIEQHGNFIIEGLKSLFIPSDEFFKSYFDDLYGWFSDRFGFLSFPIDLLVKFSDLILSSGDVDCVLILPSFDIMGEHLLYEQTFNLTDFLEENFMVVLSALRMGSSVLLIMAFVNLCGDKWEEVMRN